MSKPGSRLQRPSCMAAHDPDCVPRTHYICNASAAQRACQWQTCRLYSASLSPIDVRYDPRSQLAHRVHVAERLLGERDAGHQAGVSDDEAPRRHGQREGQLCHPLRVVRAQVLYPRILALRTQLSNANYSRAGWNCCTEFTGNLVLLSSSITLSQALPAPPIRMIVQNPAFR